MRAPEIHGRNEESLMPGVASIIIQVDEKGAVDSFNRLDAASKQLDPGLQKVQQRSNTTFKEMEAGHVRARQSAQLLANMTGVQLPRALEAVLAKTPGVQSALNAAFAATIVVTLAKEVLSLVDNLTGFSEQLAKIKEQNDAIVASVESANKTLLGPQSKKQIVDDLSNTQKQINALNQQLGLNGDAWHDAATRGLARYDAASAIAVDHLD